ncbi:MAG: VCBS repeat-containing protein [Bacteroidota bacterium]
MKKKSPVHLLVLFVPLFSLLHSCGPKKQQSSFLFDNLDSDWTNIHFKNIIVENELTNSFLYEYVYNGGGVAVGDLNNDGLEDIYFTSNLSKNHLYLNKGQLQFEDITTESGTAGNKGWTTGTNMIDINNDGLLDIYVCKSGPYKRKALLQNELYVNQGPNEDGIPTFKEEAEKFGLADAGNSIQSAFIDYDLDGDLDMYLMNHNPQTFGMGNTESFSPLGDQFYENNNGNYVNITRKVGIYSNAISYGLGVGVGDLNKDGWPDIYVSNDYDEPDYMYINQKNGSFKEVAKQALNHMSNFSMGNDIADFDNDGYLDILTLDMVSEDNYGMKTSMASMNPEKFQNNVQAGKHYQYMYNTLQKHSSHVDSSGIPFFSEVAQKTGISNTDWSWAPLMADFDNDGLKDVFISNGIKRDFRNKDFFAKMKEYMNQHQDALSNPEKITYLINSTPHRPYQNYFYKNTGRLAFENATNLWLQDSITTYSNGAAYADLDNDGDLDVVVNNVDEKASILENNSNRLLENNYIKLRFKGPKANSMGIGAKVKLYNQGELQEYTNYSVRGYQSSVPPNLTIGLGNTNQIDSLFVYWSKDEVQLVENPQINTDNIISYDQKAIINKKKMPDSEKLFQVAHVVEGISHLENYYDDYEKQVLLPHKLSKFGPAMAVADINGDNREDFFLGQSTGTPSSIFVQQPNGSFKEHQVFTDSAIFEDVDAQFFDFDNDGDQDLMVASGGNEFEQGSPNYADRLYENRGGRFHLRSDLMPQVHSSSSRIKVSDFDQDGFMDVFIGGRFIPHDYPSPASSYLFRNEKGKFVDVTREIAPELNAIGLVTDGVWMDYDQDNDLDLCIVGEWMGPTFFENQNGKFEKKDIPTIESLSGWYYAVQSMDIDQDGDEDLILGNLGQNYKYKANQHEPFEVYYHDFDTNGSKDLVLGYYNFGELFPVRGRECSSQQMPSIKKITPTYDLFGKSTISDIYGHENLSEALHLTAYNFKSGVLLNNGSMDFEFIAFPEMAQLSSINAILGHDVDKDGKIDLIIGGNLFSSEIETPRNDAGYGLVLKNSGDGQFVGINADKTGLFAPADLKNLSFIEISGTTHLLVGNNNHVLQSFSLKP